MLWVPRYSLFYGEAAASKGESEGGLAAHEDGDHHPLHSQRSARCRAVGFFETLQVVVAQTLAKFLFLRGESVQNARDTPETLPLDVLDRTHIGRDIGITEVLRARRQQS